jgi:hypothetical protein
VASCFVCVINKQTCNLGRSAMLLRRFCFETLSESTLTSVLRNVRTLSWLPSTQSRVAAVITGRAVKIEPFAADAVRLWELNRVSPATSGKIVS